MMYFILKSKSSDRAAQSCFAETLEDAKHIQRRRVRKVENLTCIWSERVPDNFLSGMAFRRGGCDAPYGACHGIVSEWPMQPDVAWRPSTPFHW